MSVYKYVTQEGALRYLRTWALRITPPDQFNDPFEMRPLVELSPEDMLEQAPSIVIEQMKIEFEKAFKNGIPEDQAGQLHDLIAALARYCMREMSQQDEDRFLEEIKPLAAPNFAEQIAAFRIHFDAKYKEAIEAARAQVPAFSKVAQSAMHRFLPQVIGVLCLSGSNKHPLMWSHYTDSHKGALLEFDENAPCFNRKRSDDDDFGILHRVWYADSRPKLFKEQSADALVGLALTKALEWSYEQELRILWPLKLADRTVESEGKQIHLIDVPATALRSITIGCKAEPTFLQDVLRALIDAKAPRGIAIRVASLDEEAFSLNYQDIC